MCGFAGVLIHPDADLGPAGEHARRMAATLRHRGPDDEGTWQSPDGRAGLGFRRLAIVDLTESGHQPMMSASGRFTVVFNGEIYNHVALRDELAGRGHSFRGTSDTEVLLAAVEEWGLEAALTRFVGMFAIALRDERNGTVSLVRDRLGVKPLFYSDDGRVLAFASELKALVEAPGFHKEVDLESLTTFLRYLYVPAPATIWKGARKVLPGQILTFSAPGRPATAHRYWSARACAEAGRADPFRGTEAEAADELERLVTAAVSDRLRADVPLGAFLSAGVDSTTVVALMARASSGRVRTISVGFDAEEHDEAGAAAEIAAHLGTDHSELLITGDEALGVVASLPEIFDEPHADTSQIPAYLMCAKARGEVTVALSGDGGDEVFGGYHRYIDGVGLLRRLQGVPGPVRSGLRAGLTALSTESWDRLFKVAGPVLPSSMRRRLPGEKIGKLARLLPEDSAEAMYRSLVSAWPDPEALTSREGGGGDRLFEELSASGGTLLDRMMLADQLVYLPDDQLAKVDRVSMAVSLEVRVPLVDHRLLEFSWRLSPEMKIRGGVGKYLLREVLYRHVPRHLVERPKMGLSVPLVDWLRGPLREWAEDLLDPARMRDDGYLDPVPIQKAWARLQRGRHEDALGLWAVLQFQAWRRRWLP
jgi:asparagine synthase (glutamine-hydrolysing)